MIRKVAVLAVVVIILAALGYGGQALAVYSWDQVVEYKSPYTKPLPVGNAGDPLTDQVVIVVVDALRVDALPEMPTLNALRDQGADLIATTGEPSLSLPGWTVLSSGAYQETTGVTTNWYEGTVKVETIFSMAQKRGLSTAVVGSSGWEQLFGPWVEYGEYREAPEEGYKTEESIYQADEDTLAKALQLLRKKKPDLLLVHFIGPDEIGHLFGGGTPEYANVVQQVDGHMAKLVAAMDLSSSTLIVTADHGMTDVGGHGGWEKVVKEVPLIFAGKRIRGGAYPVAKQADIAPTVALLLGTSIPAHNQGQALLGLLEAPAEVKGRRGLDVALQLVGFYDAYAEVLGAKPFAGQVLTADREAIARGEEGALSDFVTKIGQKAQAARSGKLNWSRLGRLPIALIILILPAVYIFFSRPWRAWFIPLLGLIAYFILYNVIFFVVRGHYWSLSVYKSESLIKAFFNERLLDSAMVMLLVGLLVGVLTWRKSKYEVAKSVVHTSLLVVYALLLQVVLYYWLYNISFSWYLPDLHWGFKYYLDLLQMVPTGFLAIVLPLLVLGGQWGTRRVLRREPVPVEMEAPEPRVTPPETARPEPTVPEAAPPEAGIPEEPSPPETASPPEVTPPQPPTSEDTSQTS
ncbi:MAG: alkaline phosphatase family protein [Anaerolineae bacterium]